MKIKATRWHKKNVGPTNVGYLFDQLLWSIFQVGRNKQGIDILQPQSYYNDIEGAYQGKA